MEWKESENYQLLSQFSDTIEKKTTNLSDTYYLFCDSHCVVHSKATQGE